MYTVEEMTERPKLSEGSRYREMQQLQGGKKKNVCFRFPDELMGPMRERARKNRRSLNAEVALAMEKVLLEYGDIKTPIIE